MNQYKVTYVKHPHWKTCKLGNVTVSIWAVLGDEPFGEVSSIRKRGHNSLKRNIPWPVARSSIFNSHSCLSLKVWVHHIYVLNTHLPSPSQGNFNLNRLLQALQLYVYNIYMFITIIAN